MLTACLLAAVAFRSFRAARFDQQTLQMHAEVPDTPEAKVKAGNFTGSSKADASSDMVQSHRQTSCPACLGMASLTLGCTLGMPQSSTHTSCTGVIPTGAAPLQAHRSGQGRRQGPVLHSCRGGDRQRVCASGAVGERVRTAQQDSTGLAARSLSKVAMLMQAALQGPRVQQHRRRLHERAGCACIPCHDHALWSQGASCWLHLLYARA